MGLTLGLSRVGPASFSDGSWIELSGKMAVLARLLANIRETTDDRIVLVSNYTQVRENLISRMFLTCKGFDAWVKRDQPIVIKYSSVLKVYLWLLQRREHLINGVWFFQTLDLFSQICRERQYPYVRLDGTTTLSKRQKLVQKFNDPAQVT